MSVLPPFPFLHGVLIPLHSNTKIFALYLDHKEHPSLTIIVLYKPKNLPKGRILSLHGPNNRTLYSYYIPLSSSSLGSVGEGDYFPLKSFKHLVQHPEAMFSDCLLQYNTGDHVLRVFSSSSRGHVLRPYSTTSGGHVLRLFSSTSGGNFLRLLNTTSVGFFTP